jgi:broad-specificity NMP kinase
MRVLIAGVSGTGKTTVGKELSKRGYKVLETDHLTGLSSWVNINTGKNVPHKPPFSEEWLNQHHWIWNEKVLNLILSQNNKEGVFFVGDATNSMSFFKYFNHVFLLKVDRQTLKHRLQNREPEKTIDPERWLASNPEIHRILDWNDKSVHEYSDQGAIVLDGNRSPAKIADEMINILKNEAK